MKVVNKTRYRTRPLKALLVEVQRRCARNGITVPQWRAVEVHVTLSRAKYDCQPAGGQLGSAYIGPADATCPRRRLVLTLPAQNADPLRIVREFEAGLMWLHEGAFNTYPFPGDSSLTDKTPWADAIVGGGVVPQQPLPPKPKGTALQEQRYKKVKALLKKWEAKRKFAENKIKKYRKQQRYYEKHLA